MKSRLIGHGIGMSLIQPLPSPQPHTQGGFFDYDFHEAQCLTLKKRLPSEKCDVILLHTIMYVLMLHFALLPYFREYFMPIESPEMFIIVYWV